ncbi:TPM domain-containing protein [Agromyces mediolanus]|uniref:TPM domain-containing protein n=1 Tax=Agromyces mediolanus TaxID=41986 RepID=UPI002041477E|nr:TPM domain-containing protein [Agromyces mediolanus]MCM3656623.1 TPM domain-containing protein [Agromyces mediolanus]
MSKRRLGSMLLALGAVLAAVAVPAGIAHAEDPVSFGSSPVVDQAGVLGEQLASVEQALVAAGDRSGRQLYVAYVDEFTNPSSAVEWAADTAVGANMGAEDYLLAVAVDGRAYYLSADQNASLSDAELDRISSEIVEPRLRDGDWAGAATAAADAIAGGAGAGGGWWGWVIALLVVAAVVVVIVLVVRSRRRRGAGAAGAAGPPPPSLEELRRTAGGALVQIDDALKTSEEELGFAVASYGDEATAPFREALAAAKGKVREAFAIQQQLDDEVPDTDEQRREWYTTIIRVTGEADALLDAQAERFDALRELERTAPEALARVRQAAASVETNAAPAAARLASLQAQYAGPALAAIADNPTQARARLDFAREAMTEAEAAIARGEQGPAAVEIRAAEEAVDQAKLLAAAVERLAAELSAADAAVAAGVADLEHDVQTARGMPGDGLAALAEQTAAEAAALRSALSGAARDPLALQARLAQANAAIDQAIAGARDAAERAQRAAAQLQRTLAAASAKAQTAEDYIVARRGAIGPEARTRVAEARRLVTEAGSQAPGDPVAALATAQQAERLADEAISLARTDVGGFGGGGGYGGGFGGPAAPAGRSSGGDLFGAVLGGILIDNLLGGGGGGRRSSSGWGGGSSSSGGFGGFGGGSSGRRSAGSFGGSGTRSRRGSGGRF